MKSLAQIEHDESARAQREAEARDAALDRLAESRQTLIALGRGAADAIARERGKVTSTLVFERLREQGHGRLLDGVDPRWIGVVFRAGWAREGWEPTGSHGRPVAIWRRA